MLRKLLIIWGIIVLTVVGMATSTSWAIGGAIPAGTMVRICDGIGRQYSAVSCNYKNQYGFGGTGDTLASDSTVSRGTIMNIHRAKEGDDPSLSELLPILLASRSALDSSYIYTKWSPVCWGINNYYSSVGGISGYVSARIDSGRLSYRFARVARANGIYLAPKTVFSESLNFGWVTVHNTDSTVAHYSDSSAIDSTLYGASKSHGGSSPVFGCSAWIKGWAGDGVGTCTLQVYGSNQNLVHGREWRVNMTGSSAGPVPTKELTPVVTGDSLYNIDSVKVKRCTGVSDSLAILFHFKCDRTDSL